MPVSAETIHVDPLKGHIFDIVNSRPNEPQRQFNSQFLLPWAFSLPRPSQILDLAAGQGIEAQYLSQKGFPTIAADISRQLMHEGYHDVRIASRADQIPLKTASLSGVLLKDALLFICPEKREEMIKEVKRVLKPQGSLLISSEIGDCLRIKYKPFSSQYPQKESYRSNDEWQKKYEQVKREGTIHSVEFITTPEEVQNLAERHGLSYHLHRTYNFNDPLADENRWIQKSGFIAELKKI